MNYTPVETPSYGTVHLNHNSDFSGDCFVNYTDDDGDRRTVRLPGEVLLALGLAAAHRSLTDKLIGFLEQLGPPGHPAETDPPRPDGLGWQHGDSYYIDRYVDKYRGGHLIARIKSRYVWEWKRAGHAHPRVIKTPHGQRLEIEDGPPDWSPVNE